MEKESSVTITKEDLGYITELYNINYEKINTISNKNGWDLHNLGDYLLTVWQSPELRNIYFERTDFHYWTELFQDASIMHPILEKLAEK